MKVLICGAGQVGFGIAERLARERNDVTVVDTSRRLIDSISDTLDVRGIIGHGSHPDVLQRAGAEDADMIIAVTLYDEVNMMACQVAHSLFDIPTKIARVRAQAYRDPMWQNMFTRNHMPIDFIISPEVEVGESVLRRLAFPGAFETVEFADQKVTVIGMTCNEDCPVVDTPLSQLSELFPDLGAIVVGIVREGRVFVPHGNDQMLAGDNVYVVTERGQEERTLGLFGHRAQQAHRITIAGAGNIGLYVARHLEEANPRARIKLIETNRERAVLAADVLKRSVVLHGNTLDNAIQREAGIETADAFVALTNDDKVNILSAVMAKEVGAAQVFSLVSNSAYDPVQQGLGIDAFINPRVTTISTILRHFRRGRIRGVHSFEDGAAEVIEAEALETSPLVGIPLRDANLPDGMRIGAIVRGKEVLHPDGDQVIEAHDRIVIFALAERVRDVEQLFRVSLEFF